MIDGSFNCSWQWSDYRDKDGKLVYGWPYTNKCPMCGAEAMVGVTCMACGKDQHQEACPVCGTWQNHRHFEQHGGQGCVKCYPLRLEKERRAKWEHARKVQERRQRLYRG